MGERKRKVLVITIDKKVLEEYMKLCESLNIIISRRIEEYIKIDIEKLKEVKEKLKVKL